MFDNYETNIFFSVTSTRMMHHQKTAWEREYRKPILMTGDEKPQSDVLRFLKFLKKEYGCVVEGKHVLDLGSGTGRNAQYIAGLGNNVIGIEISPTALGIAKNKNKKEQASVDYRLGDIGMLYSIDSDSIDIVLDVTSSNSLNEQGREVYLQETSRVLKKGGYMFVRALCKDGNANVKNLLRTSPGKEYDTYYLKEMDLVERVFSREDIVNMYAKYFTILTLEKKTGYPSMAGRVYKRDYWIMYVQK